MCCTVDSRPPCIRPDNVTTDGEEIGRLSMTASLPPEKVIGP